MNPTQRIAEGLREREDRRPVDDIRHQRVLKSRVEVAGLHAPAGEQMVNLAGRLASGEVTRDQLGVEQRLQLGYFLGALDGQAELDAEGGAR